MVLTPTGRQPIVANIVCFEGDLRVAAGIIRAAALPDPVAVSKRCWQAIKLAAILHTRGPPVAFFVQA